MVPTEIPSVQPTTATTAVTGGVETYDCSLFLNYFTVHGSEFTDVCGNIYMYGIDYNGNRLQDSYLSDHTNSADDTFKIYGGELIAFSPFVPFDNDQWAIIYEGYSTKSSKTGYNIILGPGGQSQNCQLRYEYGNGICMYSYYSSYSSFCVSLPYDIDVLHTLIIYYNNGVISVYQNGDFVQSITKTFEIAFSRIGGWYHSYYGQIAVKNIGFLKNVPLDTIQSFMRLFFILSSTTHILSIITYK